MNTLDPETSVRPAEGGHKYILARLYFGWLVSLSKFVGSSEQVPARATEIVMLVILWVRIEANPTFACMTRLLRATVSKEKK